MMTPLALSFTACLLFTLLAEVASEWLFPRSAAGRRPRPSAALGLIAGIGFLWAFAPLGMEGSARPGGGGSLLWVLFGALVLFFVGLRSDYTRPRSRNHFIGTIIAGLLCVLGGFSFTIIAIPAVGTVEPGFLLATLLTVILVFLMVSMIELCSLLPLATGLVAFLIGSTILFPMDVWESFAGFVLCGALMGSSVGRLVGKVLTVRSDPHEKADVLVIGFIAACAILATFLKSVTVAAFILPLGFLATLFVLAGLQSFDRVTLLRGTPREG